MIRRPMQMPVTRRSFLKTTAVATGGFVVGFQLSRTSRAYGTDPSGPFVPNAFVRIAPDETVTVLVKSLEFGQGVLTSFAMIAAEELDCAWKHVRAEHSPVSPEYVHTYAPMQFTGGSSSVTTSWMQLRQAGARARAFLVAAAAAKWEVDVSACTTKDGVVIGPDGQRATYGSLATDAAGIDPSTIPAGASLKKEFSILGKDTPRIDGATKCDGSALFGMDLSEREIPGLHTAVVARPPFFGGTAKSMNLQAAISSPGVVGVYPLPFGVAVVGKDFWSAKKGRDALTIEWEGDTSASSDTLVNEWLDLAKTPGNLAKAGEPGPLLEKAVERIEAEFVFPYLAHAPMEPLTCAVKLEQDRCTVWSGTQMQTMDRAAAARAAGLAPEQVEMKTLLAGGGFGRRANPMSDFVTEAVLIAKTSGLPVKVIWTREDDIRGWYYRPQVVHRAVIGLDEKKEPIAWDHTIVGQSILMGTPFEAMMVKNGVDETSVEGTSDTKYALPNLRVTLHSPKVNVPVLWWRSVGHTHTAFAMETLIDELAQKAGVDPVDYRRRLLAGHPRHVRVLDLLADKAKWGSKPPDGIGRGLALHESFNSVVGEVADVSIENGQIRVHKVVAAVDCGFVVNPSGARAQVEGAIAYGLSAALLGKLTVKDGRVVESNFHDYQVLRYQHMPEVEVHFVATDENPTGLGEPGTPPIAPAVANAVAMLTGKRLRKLPFSLG